MAFISDFVSDNLQSLEQMLDPDASEKTMTKSSYNYLALSEYSFVVNLINIPCFFRKMGLFYGILATVMLISLTSFSFMLLGHICKYSGKTSIKSQITNAFLRKLVILLFCFTTLLKIVYTCNHLIGYLAEALSGSSIFNSVVLSILLIGTTMLFPLYKNITRFLTYATLLLAISMAGYSFYVTLDSNKPILYKTFHKSDFYDETGIFCLWLTPNLDICSSMTSDSLNLSISISHVLKTVVYLTIGIFGYIGFSETEDIFVSNFKFILHPLIILFYILSLMRIPQLVVSVTDQVSVDVLGLIDPSNVLHCLVGGLLGGISFMIVVIPHLRTVTLILAVSASVILPGILGVAYRSNSAKYNALSWFNIIAGLMLILCSFI